MAAGSPNGVALGNLLLELFPNGTGGDRRVRQSSSRRWNACPPWPPDLFAIAATFAMRSGCYAEQGIILSRDSMERERKQIWAREAVKLGQEWTETGEVPKSIGKLWREFTANKDAQVYSGIGKNTAIKQLALRLLAVADEASAGFGFVPEPGISDLSAFVFDEMFAIDSKQPSTLRLPHSLAWQIAPARLCVMPKSLTPSVGCTLRSLTHHLALLPGIGVVKPYWFIATSEFDLKSNEKSLEPKPLAERRGRSTSKTQAWQGSQLNILLVPFPFDIAAGDFYPTKPPDSAVDGYFGLKQGWLRAESGVSPGSALAAMVADLVENSNRRVGNVDVVVLPEAALDKPTADEFIEKLACLCERVEIVICGSLDKSDGKVRNQAILARLSNGIVQRAAIQSKHHRWRLDGPQISRYQLARQLDPSAAWWEAIDVEDREIIFGLARKNTVFAALICEDLARFDPVLPTLNAVGPNLVVALLMDGPQIERRWPGRYATVLADDPGSAVLTITSLGMVRLSRVAGQFTKNVIGLWKDPRSGVKELELPEGAHGLALSLDIGTARQTTIDLRHDNGEAVTLSFAGAWPIELTAMPGWLAKP